MIGGYINDITMTQRYINNYKYVDYLYRSKCMSVWVHKQSRKLVVHLATEMLLISMSGLILI